MRDIYDIEKAVLPYFETLTDLQLKGADITEEDGRRFVRHLADLIRKDLEMNTAKKITRKDILDEAKKCVCGQREQDYGSPESNFGIIADLWSSYTGHKYTPVDVANMMILLKLARIKNGGGTGDSFVDIAGYAACGGEIHSGNGDDEDLRKIRDEMCDTCSYSYKDGTRLCSRPCNAANGFREYQYRGDAERSERSNPSICEKCKHWCHLYNGIYGCVHWVPCGKKYDYAGFEPRTEEDKRDEPCNTCCFGPDFFETPIAICKTCENHKYYTKAVENTMKSCQEETK